MNRKIFLLFTGVSFVFVMQAQNPIVPERIYMADPSAHVWRNGKLYVYGSVDESARYYCSRKYHVLVTSDMIHWEIVKDIFASAGPGDQDQVSYNDDLLFAPDCACKDGKYYLYYCQPNPEAAEGVAYADTPVGPFLHGQKIEAGGIEEIDPCVFIDDDGQGYYIWGQFHAKIAKLKPDMTGIDTTTIVEDLLTEEEHHFHEGGYMIKRKGIYYFIYADIERAGMPTCLGYATSRSPMGPFPYRGVIIDNDHCDPGNWNNHGSLVEYKGQWYVFYHRSTHDSKMMRKICVEPIHFNEDGSINEVEMTSQGVGPPLNPCSRIEAERACLMRGNVRITSSAEGKEELGGIRNGDQVAYKYFDFNKDCRTFTARVKPGKRRAKIFIATGEPWGKKLGTLNIPAREKDNGWHEYHCHVEAVKGLHALWLTFIVTGDDLLEIDWIKFSGSGSSR